MSNSISFNSGDDVQEGATLLKLRTADDVARLESLKAMAELNEITLDRAQRLLKTQAVSQAQFDTDAANLKNAKAQVAQQQAVIDKKILRAPFAGHLGIRAVDLGQYLGAGTPIVTLQALDPIYVDFYRPATVGRSGPARPTGGREGRRLQRSDLLPARFPRSIRKSISPIATCRFARC